MSRADGSTLLHASPVRSLIWCKFLAGVARAAKEIGAAQIFIAVIKHLFCDISRARLVIHKIVLNFVPKGSLTLEGFVPPIQISWWNSTGPQFLWIVIFSTSYIRIKYSTRKKMPTRISRGLWKKQKVPERCGVFDGDYESLLGNHVLYSHSPWATYLSLTTNIGN